MKKLIVGALGFALLLAGGCVKTDGKPDASPPWTVIGEDSLLGLTACKVVEAEGHRYLVVRVYRGVSVVHAESCPCREVRK